MATSVQNQHLDAYSHFQNPLKSQELFSLHESWSWCFPGPSVTQRVQHSFKLLTFESVNAGALKTAHPER